MIKITGNNKLLCVCKTIKNAFEFLDVIKPKEKVIVLTMDKNNERLNTVLTQYEKNNDRIRKHR